MKRKESKRKWKNGKKTTKEGCGENEEKPLNGKMDKKVQHCEYYFIKQEKKVFYADNRRVTILNWRRRRIIVQNDELYMREWVRDIKTG